MADLSLTDLSGTTTTTVRAADDTAAAAALGLHFGAVERRHGDVVARIRPDEWLVVGSTTLVDGLDRAGFVSVIDSTHSRLLFRLSGVDSARVLEKLCSLDFGDHMTPDSSCASAAVAKVTCDIMRDDVASRAGAVRSYLLVADTSYHRYLWRSIADAMQEFTG